MAFPSFRSALILLVLIALVPLQAASVSKQQADVFSKKVALIQQQGEVSAKTTAAARRTALSEDELNSWFAYQAPALLPNGLTDPKITIVGEGKVAGQATVDLEAVAKKRATGGTFDPWSLVGGRVPRERHRHPSHARRHGPLRAAERRHRRRPGSEGTAAGSREPVLAHLRASRRREDGRRIPLPAKIRQIEVGQGQAVIVQ